MSAKYLKQNAAFEMLQEQLHAVVQQLRSGMDVAPAQRLRLEGIAAALIADGIDIDVLARDCVAVASDVMVVTRDGDTLHFDCWQQRAPVYPTTAD